jgi:hypothetical protein
MFGQVVDEPASSKPFVHSFAVRGIELEATVEKESGDRLLLKTAGTNECLFDGGGIATGAAPCCFEKIAHAIVVTQCRENIQRARQDTLAQQKLQHSPGAGPDGAFPYRRLCRSARIQQKLGALDR